MDLLKLRCICRLRETGMDCWSSHLLLKKILDFLNGTALEIHQPWLLACESTVLETFRTRCNCLGLEHLDGISFAKRCASSGLHRYLLETAQDMPLEAPSRHGGDQYNYLELALVELENADTQKATAIRLLNQALEYGCDPNMSLWRGSLRKPCRQSKWEHWLHVQYVYSQQHTRAAKGDRAHQSTAAARDIDCQRMRENASIVESLLRHGADPNCTTCTTDHWFEDSCSLTALHAVLESIVPGECLSPLRTLLVTCSGEDRRYTLHRNQRKRAIRSYVISEQIFFFRVHQRLQQNEPEDCANYHWDMWRSKQELFLESLIIPHTNYLTCETCEQFDGYYYSLLEWCLDCGSRSHACLSCIRPLSLTKHAPCPNLSNPRITQPQRHTTVAVVFGKMRKHEPFSDWEPADRDSARLSTAYQSLGWGPGELCLTPGAALSVLKEWYARNPLEPDSSEADFQGMALPEELSLAE